MLRLLHPAAGIGLLLNFFFAYIIFSALSGMDVSHLEGQERELAETLLLIAAEAKPFFYALLAAQAVALGLILTGGRFGLGLAAISALFMLPGSLIYLVGSALTHYRVKYAAFVQVPRGAPGAYAAFPGVYLKKARVLTMGFLIAALFCLLLGMMSGGNTLDLTMIFLGLSLAGSYGMARARRHAALGLYEQSLILTPALFAPSLLIDYTDIGEATLNEDASIFFEVRTPQGPARLAWHLNSVVPEQRRAALEELSAALTANNVTLR